MTTTVIIPLRGLHGGKSRLAPVLDPAERATLIGAMARHVVGVVHESGIASDVMLVTREPDVATRAGIPPGMVRAILQPEAMPGLNAAVDVGRRAAQVRGATTVVILSADMPELGAADLRALAAVDAGVVLAPDRAGAGTNGLLLRGELVLDQFAFRFGRGSRALHEEMGHELGACVATFQRDGLALDLDTPEDWAMLTGPARDRLLTPIPGAWIRGHGMTGRDPVAIMERA